MRVLYLTDPAPDYLADQIYDGLCSVLGWTSIVDFPRKVVYHDPGEGLPYLAQNPGHQLTTDDVGTMIRERRIDLAVVSSVRRGALEAFQSLAGSVVGVPVVLLDGEDDGRIRTNLLESVGAGLYFKREYKSPPKSADRRWWRPANGAAGVPSDDRVHPLPFSVTSALLAPLPSEPRVKDVDISFIGRASNRKRVRAINLLRRTKDIRFEGGLYLDAADRRSKLAASWLGVATAKLIGDPRAPSREQVAQLGTEPYRALLHRSKMALSVRGGGFDTLRYWEIVASQTLLVSEPPDIMIPHNFEHGRHVMFCRHDLRDLPAIVRRLRDDDQTRQRMVEAAYGHLLAFHTSERRAAYLLDLCRRTL
jgi:hypothetical protein